MKTFKPLPLAQAIMLLAGMTAYGAQAQDNQAQAGQTADAKGQSASASEEEVVVRGYRDSLLNSTVAKRNSVGVVDEIFASDIGKMPSQNLAESLARIPGVKISREVTGEGQQIAVRGLSSSFTKVVMNGNSITVASTGSLGAGQRGRQVDLDLFQPELFRSLSVNKTATSDQIEGGVSGYVNMRTLRASDLGDGSNYRFGVEEAYNEMSGKLSPKVSFTYGYKGDNFGVLFGIVGKKNKTRVDGYETIGNYQQGCVADFVTDTNNARVAQCNAGFAGGTFHYTDQATADYAADHPGVSVGDPIDVNAVSGLSNAEISSLGMPYIGRAMYTYGDRNSTSALLSLDYEPNDDVTLALNVLHAKADRNFLRNEANATNRRNYMQYGLEYLLSDVTLGEGGAIKSGTLYNDRMWVGSRQYDENLTFTSIMPSLSWQMSDVLKMDLSINDTSSDYKHDEPYLLYWAPAAKTYFAYDGDFPTIQNSVVDSAGPGWTFSAGPGREGTAVQGGAFRFQRDSRKTDAKAFHADFAYGEDADVNGIKFGLAMDQNSSNMENYSGGNAWSDRINNSDLDSNFASYVVNSPINDLGSGVSGYHGISGIASVDWAAVKNAVGYNNFTPDRAFGGDYFGQVVGDIDEKINAAYIEANMESSVNGHDMRSNMGVRYVQTKQKVSSTDDDEVTTDYSRVLPSFNTVLDLTNDIKLRASASKSFTRAEPGYMFPNASWSSSGIDSVNAGNPKLQPFESVNFDFGGEWYFSDLGYVGFTYYQKDITGFTRADNIPVQFQELTGYGLDISDSGLTQTQRDALQACGGRTSANCTTVIKTHINLSGTTTLYGEELIWVQPLDMLVEGLGFNTSFNKISQKAQTADAEVPGISDSMNFTAYYENDSFQAHITYTKTEKNQSYVGWSPTNTAARDQLDLSASYNLPSMGGLDWTLTFDAYNLTNSPLRDVFESDGNTFNIYYPGATYTFGINGSF